MAYNTSRKCRCGHRHRPGRCPRRACGCDELRTEPRVLRDITLVSWGPVLHPPRPAGDDPP